MRAQVRRPRKERFEGRVVGAEGLDLFYRLLSRRWHQLGTPILPRRFFEQLLNLFGDRVDIVVVERESEVAAVGMLLATGNSVEIPWAASALKWNKLAVNMLLYWRSMERAVERGAGVFDFGRSTPDTGNARFKLQWGAEEKRLIWNVRVREGKGDAMEKGSGRRDRVASIWRCMPEFLVSRVGPMVAARVPY